MKRLVWTELGAAERTAALARPEARGSAALKDAVRSIVEEVRAGGWNALVRQAERIDGSAPRLFSCLRCARRACWSR